MFNNKPEIVQDFKWVKVLYEGCILFKIHKDNPNKDKIVAEFIKNKLS